MAGEQAPKFESSIDRHNKRLKVELGGRAILFDYNNTVLYEHHPPYEMFDHIFRLNDRGDNGTYYLRDDSPKAWEAFVEQGFPRRVQPYPTEGDERLILNHHANKLEEELEAFRTGEAADE